MIRCKNWKERRVCGPVPSVHRSAERFQELNAVFGKKFGRKHHMSNGLNDARFNIFLAQGKGRMSRSFDLFGRMRSFHPITHALGQQLPLSS